MLSLSLSLSACQSRRTHGIHLWCSCIVQFSHGSHCATNAVMDGPIRSLKRWIQPRWSNDLVFHLFLGLFSIQSKALSILHAEHATGAAAGLGASSGILHLFRDLDVDFEEFGDAAVEADALAFAQVGFAIIGRDTFLQTGLC
jgi:hypothetical protein